MPRSNRKLTRENYREFTTAEPGVWIQDEGELPVVVLTLADVEDGTHPYVIASSQARKLAYEVLKVLADQGDAVCADAVEALEQ